MKAIGSFDVKLTPQPSDDGADPSIGRFLIDKQYHGELSGTAKGEMLAHRTSVEGSAGYVAIERVSGMLAGRTGTFVLQHSAVMTRGAPQLTIIVVPDSGTGELAGLAGTLNIDIRDGKHFYDFEYTIGE